MEETFTEEALAFLAKAADGVPRCLNHLADHSLLLAFVTERRPVSAEIVREALDDLKQLPLQWNDPISGGEIYRGLSQRPPMEDSAVDLWPQQPATTEDERQENSSWDESSFGNSSAAIEIGGELDEASEELLDDVAELAQTLEDDGELRPLGQTFAARAFEFGAPSPQSFAVEEFAGDSEIGDDDPDREFRDESSSDRWSSSEGDDAQPVWNLPKRSWTLGDDAEIDFEEEPVIDRYVRIENDTSSAVTNWNCNTPHSRTAANRTVTAVKTTRPVMAAADATEEQHGSLPSEPETGSDLDSGIVESYSRPAAKRWDSFQSAPGRGQTRLASADGIVESHSGRRRHRRANRRGRARHVPRRAAVADWPPSCLWPTANLVGQASGGIPARAGNRRASGPQRRAAGDSARRDSTGLRPVVQ